MRGLVDKIFLIIEDLSKKLLLLLIVLLILITSLSFITKNFFFYVDLFQIAGSFVTFAVIGFLIGIIIQFLIKLFFRIPKHIRIILTTSFVISFIGIFAYWFLKVSHTPYRLARIDGTFGYINHITYNLQDKEWRMGEEIEIELSKIQDGKKAIQELTLSGWKIKKQQGDMVLLERTREQKVLARWLPFYTVNKIYLPEIKYVDKALSPFSSNITAPYARFIIDAPKNLIGLVYPSHNSREDMLENKKERITVLLSPIAVVPEEKYVLRLQVLSPLIRNNIGMSIIKILFYLPLKWLAFVLCVIFGEQIRKMVLVPLVKRIFKFFSISYLEDKKQ